LPEDKVKGFVNKWETAPRQILVTSVWPLADSQRQHLEAALRQLTGQTIPVEYRQDEELLAGLNISVGSYLLQLNVREELRGFVELADAES
jgi:F-type H+-transporting ATPase subunit b